MFAVVDVQGRVIAFSGRMLADPEPQELATLGIAALPASEGAGKYVNSPETAIYRKREAVFGLYQAKDAIRTSDRCVLVEGNFDVVSLHARGICNVVAPLGTAFTTEQARQIKRFAPEVVLLFDGDNAGRRAAASSRESCREAGLSARVAELPEGVDPDELVRQAGPEALSRVLKNAKGMLEYMIGVALEGSFAGADARSQAERIKRVADLLASEDDPAVRALAEQHADAVASRLGITDAATFRTLARAVQRGLSNGSAQQNVGPAEQAAQPPGRARSRDRHDEISLGILGAILDYPELLDTPEVQDGVQLIEGDVAAAIAAVRQAHQAGLMGHAEQVLAKLAPSIHSFAAARLAAPRHVKVEDATTELLGNVEKLKRLALKRQRSAVIEDLERAAQVGDFDREMLLLREHMRRARERHGLGER
jgi:DNA primase